MKKFTILFCILLLITLASCGGPDVVPAKDVVNGTVAALPGFFGDPAVFSSDAESTKPEHLSEQEIYALYYGDKWDLKNAGELGYVDSWCIALGTQVDVRELHVFKARSRSCVTVVKRMLESRAKTLSSPELFAARSDFLGARPSDVRVFTCGKYVVLCAGNDCGELEKILRSKI